MGITNSHALYRHGACYPTWTFRPAATEQAPRVAGAVAGAYRAVDSSARRGYRPDAAWSRSSVQTTS
jgi:hypothetical protein